MACPELEDLVNEGSGGHAVHCEGCRALLDALAHVDATFDAAFATITAPPGLAATVRDRAAQTLQERRPSFIPEILDLIGWVAVLAIAAIFVPRFTILLSSILAELG